MQVLRLVAGVVALAGLGLHGWLLAQLGRWSRLPHRRPAPKSLVVLYASGGLGMAEAGVVGVWLPRITGGPWVHLAIALWSLGLAWLLRDAVKWIREFANHPLPARVTRAGSARLVRTLPLVDDGAQRPVPGCCGHSSREDLPLVYVLRVDVTSFDMRWEIVGSGWAKLTWIADDDVLEVITSYTGHGLQSLLRAAADLQLGSSASLAWLSDEPHAHVFVFTGATEYVYAQVLVVPDEYAEDPWAGTKRRWAGRVPVQAFTTAAARMAQTVLDQHGENGYKKAWGNMPFPDRELAVLLGERP